MTDSPCRPTRFAELGYRKDARRVWRFVDRSTEASVGPHYPSRAELLADLDRYATEFGCAAAGARPSLGPTQIPNLGFYREAWRTALTLANNICVQESDRLNAEDAPIPAIHATAECARRVREWIDPTDEQLLDMLREAGVQSNVGAA